MTKAAVQFNLIDRLSQPLIWILSQIDNNQTTKSHGRSLTHFTISTKENEWGIMLKKPNWWFFLRTHSSRKENSIKIDIQPSHSYTCSRSIKKKNLLDLIFAREI